MPKHLDGRILFPPPWRRVFHNPDKAPTFSPAGAVQAEFEGVLHSCSVRLCWKNISSRYSPAHGGKASRCKIDFTCSPIHETISSFGGGERLYSPMREESILMYREGEDKAGRRSKLVFVGWVERSETHQFGRWTGHKHQNRWVSLRSTHPTGIHSVLMQWGG